MRNVLMVLVVLGGSLAACGGPTAEGSGTPSPSSTSSSSSSSTSQGSTSPPPSFDSRWTGTWTGTSTLTFEGLTPVSYSSSFPVAVNGSSMAFGNICPDGSGSMIISGSGTSVRWTGSVTCPPALLFGCSTVVVTYSSADLALQANGSLTARGLGYGTGCGATRAMNLSFVGTK